MRPHIGTSGYHYGDWSGLFYPKDLPKKAWFSFYSRHFDTLEINASFYRLPSLETFAAWRERAPEGFVHAVKFSRFGTHMKRLLDARSTISLFLDRAEALADTLGPILVQLPPRFRCNPERLDHFLAHAPRRHRWAVEMRDPSWLCEESYRVLERHRAALVFHDIIPDHPRRVTGDFIYLRFHGVGYAGRYSRQALAAEARRIEVYLREGLEVFAYFNNDKGAAAIADAQALKRFVDRRLSNGELRRRERAPRSRRSGRTSPASTGGR